MPLRHIRTTLGAPPIDDAKPGWLIRVVQAVIPAANPDFMPLYPQVRSWLVEITEDGTPQREVGLDSNGMPLVAGPVGENTGYWTDSNYQFAGEQQESVSAQEFISAWHQAVTAWQRRTSKSDA